MPKPLIERDIPEDTVLSTQFQNPGHLNPEHLFLAAIFESAKSDYYSSNKNHQTDAKEWFNSQDEFWPTSFINICAVFKVSPDQVRRDLESNTLAYRRRLRASSRTRTKVLDANYHRDYTRMKRRTAV